MLRQLLARRQDQKHCSNPLCAPGFFLCVCVRQIYRRPQKHCIHKKSPANYFLARLQLQLHKNGREK